MARVEARALPDGAFLHAYRERGAYTDCYAIELPRAISFEQYVAAFYTTWVFRTERLILRLVDRPSTGEQARALASGAIDRFAAWNVEQRGDDQMLLTDNVRWRTRSWLMIRALDAGSTRLYFGSAVVPMGQPFQALIGFHQLYSRILLGAAAKKLSR